MRSSDSTTDDESATGIDSTQSSKLHAEDTTPDNGTPDDKETARITACLASGPTVSKVAEEAYRLCRINSYLRKDRKQAQDELRRERTSFRSRQAVLDDAIAELRVDYPETRMLLDRAWELLEQRNLRIPSDMKMAYHVLKEPNIQDWQARKGFKVDVSLRKTASRLKKRAAMAERIREGRARKVETEAVMEQEKHKSMVFLVHTDEGRTYNLRDPTADDYSDNGTAMDDSDSELDDGNIATEAFSAGAGSVLNDKTTINPLGQLDAASSQDGAQEDVALSANNTVVGKKRKAQGEEHSVQKKPRLEDEENQDGGHDPVNPWD